mgnify:CR=1 FL=1
MISHVLVCLLAHEEKGLISNTFCHAKREYSFSVRPIRFFFLLSSNYFNTVLLFEQGYKLYLR